MRGLRSTLRRMFHTPVQPMAFLETLEPRQLMSVSATGLSGIGTANIGKQYHLATFTSADAAPQNARNYSATINYEDGTSGQGKIQFAKGVFTVIGSHKYTDPGLVAPVVTINDKIDGTNATVDSNLLIDPSHSGGGLTKLRVGLNSYFTHFFNETFVKQGNNYKARTIKATRISDRSDINWTGSIVTANVLGSFAFNSETFGYVAGTSGGSFVPLFNVNGSEYNVSGGVGNTPISGTYRFARTGDDGNIFTSNPANNADRRDHMVTYQMTGLGTPAGERTYVVFWEDALSAVQGFDFNDMIVEITLA